MTDASRGGRPAAPHRAGVSDVRNVIGALIGFYGIVLVIMGIVAESAEVLNSPMRTSTTP